MFQDSVQILNGGGIIASIFVQVVFWGFRIQQDTAGVKRDLPWILSGLFLVYRQDFYSGILEAPSYIWTLVWPLSLCIIFLFMCYRWLVYWRFSQRSSTAERGNNAPNPRPISKFKPLIFPCRTSHTRIFPRKHSFSYSYLFVGVPIGYQGSSGSLLSVGRETFLDGDEKTKHVSDTTKSWFHVDAADYLSRGKSSGLEGKLHAYLRSQVGYAIFFFFFHFGTDSAY